MWKVRMNTTDTEFLSDKTAIRDDLPQSSADSISVYKHRSFHRIWFQIDTIFKEEYLKHITCYKLKLLLKIQQSLLLSKVKFNWASCEVCDFSLLMWWVREVTGVRYSPTSCAPEVGARCLLSFSYWRSFPGLSALRLFSPITVNV